ncbi:hypothetical protein NE850_09520 [Paraburkholderia sp. USG1]|nr:hypothetical protein [Paraburkholderia sp. USG1]MDR8396578.1 hypothetical protein [Paraburkholderia sp. USG1]
MRRHTSAGLNKGKACNSLARAVLDCRLTTTVEDRQSLIPHVAPPAAGIIST